MKPEPVDPIFNNIEAAQNGGDVAKRVAERELDGELKSKRSRNASRRSNSEDDSSSEATVIQPKKIKLSEVAKLLEENRSNGKLSIATITAMEELLSQHGYTKHITRSTVDASANAVNAESAEKLPTPATVQSPATPPSTACLATFTTPTSIESRSITTGIDGLAHPVGVESHNTSTVAQQAASSGPVAQENNSPMTVHAWWGGEQPVLNAITYLVRSKLENNPEANYAKLRWLSLQIYELFLNSDESMNPFLEFVYGKTKDMSRVEKAVNFAKSVINMKASSTNVFAGYPGK
ncbi:unnamed protein product [Caenorhabditis bovis]|uniref:Uncharacterized protein n=1 Tax=Caenorhabditis bovis TaxID=2654633 RepID=A0A8S1FEE6_9PELO|nr:unnamed protein product [Caenorhabditis bovis]